MSSSGAARRHGKETAMFHLSAGWIAASITEIVFVVAYPLVLAIIARRRLGVGWRYFWFGALIFAIFQLATRVPAVQVIQAFFGKQIAASPVLLWGWLAILVVTAALFEEVGRYIGYRLFMGREEKTWNKAVMYGLGHGGLESMLLVGFLALLSLVNLLALSSINLNTLPAAQRTQITQQLQTIAALPGWLPLLGAWERLWTVPVQVALSVIVLQVFRRGNIGWLWLAILAHAVVDGVAVGVNQALGASQLSTTLIVEGIVAVFGLIALWVIFALRDRAGQGIAAGGEPIPQAAPGANG
jgi:uncharacterized membrane protein YhfC